MKTPSSVDTRLRIACSLLVALAAACLFSIFMAAGAQEASATVTLDSYTGIFGDRNAGHASAYTMNAVTTMSGQGTQGNQGDDIDRLILDWPAGLQGNPNAIPEEQRCNVGNPALVGDGSSGQSYDYNDCPPSSRVGSIEVDVLASVQVILWVNCDITLSGDIFLLRNTPADPEVPAYVGITLAGTGSGLCSLAGEQTLTLTAKITVRPDDQGLRITVLDRMPRTKATSLGTAHLRVKAIRQTINGTAPNGNAFMRNPTRCLPERWYSKAYARAYDSNTNTNETLNGVAYVTNGSNVDPICGSVVSTYPYNPGFSLTQSTTAAGAPVGLRATLTNPVEGNAALRQRAYAKKFSMALPVGFRINPTVANRLQNPVSPFQKTGCTEPEFNQANPEVTPTCPAWSQIGTTAVTVPQVTGDLVGFLYMGQPQSGDVAARRYRLYLHAQRGGVAVKFQGRAFVDDVTGQVTVEFGDPSYTPSGGLPQFMYSSFILDFNSASAGVGSPSSGPVSNPNAQRQMLMNPQVCSASLPMTATLTPWTTPVEANATRNVNLSVTAGTNGSCNFDTFDPSFSATLSDLGVGKSPNMTLTVTRPDRQDNIDDMIFRLPDGMGGSIKAPVSECTVANVLINACTAASQVGTVTVQTGAGTDTAGLSGTVHVMERVGAELTNYTAKLAIITPASVGPFDLGNVINYSYMRLADNNGTTDPFALEARVENLQQSIQGIPILYRQIALTLNGIHNQNTGSTADDKPFLINPSKCAQDMNFQATIVSSGMAPASGTSTVVPSSSAGTTTGCSSQGFTPTLTIDQLQTAPSTPTGMRVTLNSTQIETGVTTSTIQQSTVNSVRMLFPAGMEMNPGFATSRVACPTSAINADISSNTIQDTCAASYPNSKIGDVSVQTPLLPGTITGSLYLEEQGATADTRYRFALYLAMPGGMQIVRGGARVAGSTNGPTAGLGSTSDTAGATATTGQAMSAGQIEANFTGLPDVMYSQMQLTFNSSVPLFVTPPTCGTNTFNRRLDATNTSATPNFVATNSTFTTSGCTAAGFAPTYAQTENVATANGHPNITMEVNRPDQHKDLKSITFHLPQGLTGAPTAAPTCATATAAAGNCTDASQIGNVAVDIGSGAALASITTGKLHNTQTLNADEPARFTAIVPVVLGPFNLGKMSLPVSVAMRAADFGLDASVNLPPRYEGIKLHYRKLTVTLLGTATQGTVPTGDDKFFMTNPSRCANHVTTVDVTATDNSVATVSDNYNTTGCPLGFTTTPTMTVTPTTTDTEAATGVTVNVTNGNTTNPNPSIKRIRIQFPAGTSLNPAVGNDGSNTTCATAVIDAGATACPAASNKGTIQVQTPLLAGTWSGNVYLEAPGSTAANRFRLALVIQLPGQKLIIRGNVSVNGATDLTGPTGSVDSGSGIVVADFDNIVDLPFHQMTMTLNGGNRAPLINPNTCGTKTVLGELSPNTGTSGSAQTATANSTYTATSSNCATAFTPDFTASLSNTASGANSNLVLGVTNPGKSPQLRDFNLQLPTGLVADTVSTPRCSQVNAAVGNCAANTVVGSVTTQIGNASETLSMSGTINNVVPDNANQPARLQAILPVVVGPFDLGKLSIPVVTTMRSDYGINANTQLPYRYEGIDVRIRQMSLTINGTADQGTPGNTADDKPFMINPSKCQTMSIVGTMISVDSVSDVENESLTINGCPRNYPDTVQIPKPGIAVTPTTTETAKPVGLRFNITSSLQNPTMKGIKIDFPAGIQLNPAAANGPLTTCTTAQINAGGAACLATTANIGNVKLDTPLLTTQQTGNVFLEEVLGNNHNTRYRVAVVAHLPGKDLIVRGAVSINGSSTIATGATGAVDTGSGQISTTFYGDAVGQDIPDLGFTNMEVDFNGGNRALFANARSCGAQTFTATFTPHSGGADVTNTGGYTTTSDCTAPTFNPDFTGSVTSTQSAGNPNLTMNVARGEKESNLRNLAIDLPTGLVAATGNVPRCAITAAASGTCAAASDVGNITTTIGTGGETLSMTGDLYNVDPQAGEPARLSAKIPVLVGPYNLGLLTIPISTSLRADWGVTATAQMPLRYEGIAVRIRTVAMTLLGTVGGQDFVINPSKCQTNTVGATMTSESSQSVNDSWNYTTTGCAGFGTTPEIDVEPTTFQAGAPTGLRIDINSNANNPTIKRTQFTFPQGMEINPAFGRSLVPCPTANVTAGTCDPGVHTTIADVTMTTPLLSSNPQGKLYLESPGLTAGDRYRVALILDLPGRKLVVRGAINIDGSSTIATGATGAVDTGTGQISADFDNIPDLGFTQLRLDFNGGSRAMVVNPTVCTPQTFTGVFTPHSVVTTASDTDQYTPSGCATSFNPAFSASVSTTAAAANPNLSLNVVHPDQHLQLRTLKVELPVGLVANTSATNSRCSVANANNGNCTAEQEVGSFTTSIGSGTETIDLTGGKIYNVVPSSSNEPARMQAVIPVVVGPFDLGKLSIPVTTALQSDMSVDATATLPLRYEGIAVRLRQLNMTLLGTVTQGTVPTGDDKPFIVNPSKCQVHTINGVMTSAGGSPLTNTDSSTFETLAASCTAADAAYNPSVSFTNSPQTAGAPTALGMTFDVPANSATTNQVRVIMPAGLELSPGVGNGLAACPVATVDAGGSGCPASSKLADVTLNTPLLVGARAGELYLEPSVGTAAATRYRLAMVVHLPGRDLIVRGGTLVDGSSDLTNDLGSKDTGDGHVTATFPAIPDVGFTSMAVQFNTTGNKLFVNPKTCGSHTIQAELTSNSGSVAKTRSNTITTSGGTCAQNDFNPTFTGSLSSSTSGGNPDLTLSMSNANGMQELKSFDIDLPEGLVARTTSVPQCLQADATLGSCAVNTRVGTVETTIGSGTETYEISGDIYNVVPDADSPARLQAVVPVNVGPFALGKLSVPVPTSLNSDLTVTASATLPSRYEGIAVRVREMQMQILGNPNGNKFLVAPSKCATSTVGARMTSDTGTVANGGFPITISGCPVQFASAPTMAISSAPAVRNTPANLTFTLTSNADNPTIGSMQVEMPDNMEINPSFGNGLAACAPSVVDAGGSACPLTSKIGVVTLRTQLLDPATNYQGDVYLETPGTTAATRFRIAIVAHLPGADLVVRGKVSVAGSTDITGGTGSTTEVPAGKIIAEFDDIPDLGFTYLQVVFNTNKPMLINAPQGGTQTFAVDISPHSGGSDANLAPSYVTSGGTTPATFNPSFTASIDNNTPGGHPNLTLGVTRANNDSNTIKNLDLELPVGLVASTVATPHCSQADANAGNCTAASRVGQFSTRFGNGALASDDLTLNGDIFNVAPDNDEPARLSAMVDVQVGPFDLGKLPITINTALRSDLGIDTTTVLPTRYEGIAVRIKALNITLFGTADQGTPGNTADDKPFMQNPSKCGTHTIRAQMTSSASEAAPLKQANISTSGCPVGFTADPTVSASVTPSETTVPTGLGLEIDSDPLNPTISRIAVDLPEGMSVNAAVGNGLTTCATSQLDSNHLACPLASRQGTVELETPLLADTYTGYVYLEDPLGNDATTRYRLAVVVDLPGAQMVVRGKVLIDGSSTIPTGGTGSVDTGTGRVTTEFDSVPDLSFSKLKIDFNTGPRALLTNPDSCGAHTVEANFTPSSGGAAQSADASAQFTTSYDGSGAACPGTQPFNPTFAISADDHTSGANTDLHIDVTAGAKDQALDHFNIHLPAGLVADTDATPTCSQANAAAADCLPTAKVGEVSTKLGTGSETLDISGDIFNVTPNSDEPARLAAVIPVVVGPYDLGKLSITVPTTLRGGDYGVDAEADIPQRYEGIAVRIREMNMDLDGQVGGNGFIKNPSKCTTGEDAVSATLTGTSSSVDRMADYEVTGCPRDFVSSPTITVSGTNSETAVPTGMTLDVHSADDNPTIQSVVTTMPDGMTLNPAVGNSLDACDSADIDAGGAGCPAESQIGTVEMVTPLLAGTHTGKVYLETPGNTAATRYKLAIIVDLPGTNVIVRGSTQVDGSSDLTGGVGSTDTGTGRVTATFPELPDLNFSDLKIAFAGGSDALFTNAETCGTQTVEAVFTPQSSSNTETDSDSYTTSYDGSGGSCPASEPFNPSFTGAVSTTQAAGNPDLTLTLSRGDKTQQLREFDLHLPAGLVADTVQTPRCDQADAQVGDCDASTIVGDVSTSIGTGSETLDMSGTLHNVVPDNDEPARLAAVIDVQVGPYNLGKLSIPVETEIVTGAVPSDLTIDTHTTIPQRYEGVPVRIREMQIQIDGIADQGTPTTADDKPFMINPSRCSSHTLTADMAAPGGDTATGSFNFTTTGCPAPFNPSIATSVSTSESGLPTGFNLTVNVPGNSSSIRKVSTLLPEGMEINPGVANTGGPNGLKACDAVDVETETGADGANNCDPDSIVGTVTLDTPLLPNTRNGKIYLVTPGNTPSTRYKLALVIDLPGTDLVVHGQAQVNGSGSGANSGTGQVSATFDDLPDLQFSKLEVQFASGDNAMLTNPRNCATHTTTADLTPWSVANELDPDADQVSRSADFTTSYDGAGAACPGTEPFDPSFSASVDDSDQAASPDLTLEIDSGSKDARLSEMTLGLPVGLVANTTAADQCSQADATAGTCGASSQVGEIATTIGAGGDPLAMSGEIYNVVPDADQPAKLSAKIDVQVGPYDLGTLTIPVDTAIRPGNDPIAYRQYGIDATTQVPTRFEGVAIQMRSLQMNLFGEVNGNEFIVNPSKCGEHTVTADLEGDGGQTVSKTSDIEIDNCQSAFNVAPAVTASVDPSETAVPSDLTVGITSSDQNQTIESISTQLPEGMTINPAIGNSFGTELATCPSASLDAADVSGCTDAQIGTVTLTTPLLAGTQTGKVYLETPGSGAANRYKMAIVVDLPGQKLVVRGKVDVDGSTDLIDGLGSTADSTGQMTATFEPLPDLGFTAMSVSFDTGSRSLLTNPETCGAQTVTATIMPTSGTVAATPTAAFSTSYDGAGAGCPASEPFNPTFDADFSTLQAAGNPDMTLTITRSDKTEQLREFDLALPPGLVANTVDTLRCSQAQSELANCTEASRVGDVTTKIGTGSETLDLTGGIYNVVPDNDEPARLAAIIDVIVGPYDLGKLSIPVTTEIVSGALPSDLAIETHTTIPQRYEGMPVRVREMQIKLNGMADQGTPSTSDDKPFMILPSKCATSTITANMTSSEGTNVAVGDNFTTVDCANAPYDPSISVALKPGNDAGKPVGLDLGFQFDGSSSSTKSIRTLLPIGMGINPGVGNYGSNMTCDPADVAAGGAACPAESRLGSVKLDTPLLPNQQTGSIYLETPGTGAAERYKLGLFVDLPGSGDLVVHGRATVSGSSDVVGGMGSVDTGNGQVIAEFDDLPDLQFSDLLIEFKTTGGSDHALLTNPEVCGDHTVVAEMSPWSRPTTTEQATDTITIDDCTAEGALGLTAAVSDLGVGEHADVTLNLSRPDGNKSIKNANFQLPKGLVGSADAAPTCAQVDADTGVCPASTKVGEVALQVGSTDDSFEITGDIFNTVAPSNRPAKLTFAAHVVVGPFDFGRISVPIDVNIHPTEYYLWAETGNMPQRFEGIPVRINEMQVKLFGMASQGTPSTADDKPFMSNPRTCTAPLDLTAEIVAPDNSTTDLTSQIGPFTGCENLNLDDNAIAIENYNDAPYNDKPERPTKLSVSVTQGTSATQAALKDMTVNLPGFRLSAAAANGLSACSATQLSNQNCPAASRVGTVWLDTPLLPKNETDPDGVSSDLHSLWGAVYLETPGTAADGSDRYKLAIQLTGKTQITIRGTAVVNETTGEIVTEFNDLPDIPFEQMFVDLTGADTGTGFKPLLLNPENPSTSSGLTVAAGASMNSWSAPATIVNRGSSVPVTVDAGTVKTFAPNTSSNITPMTAGAHPTAIFTYSRADGEEDIRNVKMSLPAGFLGSAAAVPQCTLAQASAGNCPAASEVGTVVVNIGQYGQYLPMSGHVYLTEGAGGDIAGMSIKVPAEAGPYDLGDYITQGRVLIRPSDHGIDVDFQDVPKMFKGVPTHISNMEITLPGTTASNKPFLYNASNCAPQQITANITPWNGAASSQNLPYQAVNCPSRTFAPAMSFNASGGNGPNDAPAWAIKMGTNAGDSTLKGVTVLLPTIMTVNVQGLASQCQPAVAAARACGPESQIGTVSIKTPLLTAPVEGKVFMAKSITGQSLPDLLIEIPAPIDMQIRGANSFVNSIQIKSDFQNLPDLVWSEMTMNIAGGPKGLITTRENGTCGPAQTSFASHSGQGVSGTSPVVGLADCINPGAKCETPTVNISTKGVKKKNNKKSSNNITFGIPSSCAGIKSFQVLYPKGSKVNKNQMKWVAKKKLNKKQKAANKKNQSNVTGKAGSKALKVFDFQAVGRNGLKVKTVPAGTRSVVLNTKNSTMLLPYKTFCGALKKGKTAKQKKAYSKALKKCQAKSVTFTFVYTLDDGKVVRYNHTMKVSDKKFK